MNRLLRLTILTALLILACGVVFSYADNVPYSESYEKCMICVDGEELSQSAVLYKSNIYVSIDVIKEYGCMDGFVFDTDDRYLYIDIEKTKTIFADADTTFFIKRNAKEASFPLKYIESIGYSVSFEAIAGLANFEWSYSEGCIDIISHNSPDDPFEYKYEAKKKQKFDEPINATWSDFSYCPQKIDGIDVFADICFYPQMSYSGKGYIGVVNGCDYGLISATKAMGYTLWLTAQNFNVNSSDTFDYIDSSLQDKASASEFAAKYLLYTTVYNADGINIDYEDMYSSTRNYFIYFVQTVCRYADKLGITTSVCTYYGNSWNNQTIYPFDIFGQCCDYICEMVYNEELYSSLSYMSKPYWTRGTDYIASLAPKEKILMGVAYYVRFTWWSGDSMNGELALSLNGVWDDPCPGLEYSWDEETGQYLVKHPYERGGIPYTAKYYVEEVRSSALKAQYIKNMGYGGTIGWSYMYADVYFKENMEMFKAYDQIYHHGGSYSDYVPE